MELFNFPFFNHGNTKGWEGHHDYHQTLLFLGETPEEKIEEIKIRMSEVFFNTFLLSIEGFNFFNRRIMYADFKPSKKLSELKKIIDQKFPEWIREREKEFIPHVTIKRWQRYELLELQKKVKAHPLAEMSFFVSQISLFKSERDADNNKYHVIYRHRLDHRGD